MGIELDAVFGLDSGGLVDGVASGFGAALGLPGGFGVGVVLVLSAELAATFDASAGLGVSDVIELDVAGVDVVAFDVVESGAVADMVDVELAFAAVAPGVVPVVEGWLAFAISEFGLVIGAAAGV